MATLLIYLNFDRKYYFFTASNQYQQVSSARPQTDSGYGAAEFVNQYDKITPKHQYASVLAKPTQYLSEGELDLENQLMSEYASARNADARAAAMQANYDDLPQPSTDGVRQ